MERKLSVAVIGHVKTSGGPSSPAPPAPTPTSSPTGVGRLGSPPTQPAPPSSPTSAAVGRRRSPPPPPRATAADRGGHGSPRTDVPLRARPPLPPPPPPTRHPSDDGVSISWGHKKKPNGGRRRPRPIGCIYPKYQAPQPRGRPRPEPVPAMRRRGVEAILVGSDFSTPKKAVTGNVKIDEQNNALCQTYGAMLTSVKNLEKQAVLNPHQDHSNLKENFWDMRTSAFQLRRIVLASGYKPVNEPLLFKGLCPR